MNDVFKILTKEEWSDASKHGYVKTDIDKNDGFIHFSTSKQLAKTLRLYFGNYDEVVLLQINEEKIQSPADDLLNMEGMDSDTAKLLASKSIITMEDLAELAADELLEIVKMDEERAKELIMTARAPWFV